jgi:hypothetical protein
MPRATRKNYAINQLASLPGVDSGKRWTFRLPRSQRVILRLLVQRDVLNLRDTTAYKGRTNAYHVHICRLRKKLPSGVTIENEWGGVYFMTFESKQILKQYERK